MATLQAAAGRIDLRPPPHRLLAGFGARLEPATGTHDPLQARMFVLDSARVRLVWVSCDVIGFSTRTDAELRTAIARRAGTSPDFVLVSCTHTHGGPLSMSFRGGTFAAAESDWLERIAESLSALAAALAADLRPAGVSVAGTTVRGLGYNRQDPSAPIDERVLVLRVTSPDQAIIATVVNAALHPVVLGEKNLQYTSDFPGFVSAHVERELGGVCLFVQGHCGDVDPSIYRDCGRHAGTFEIADDIGRAIADGAIAALAGSSGADADPSLAVVTRDVSVPLDPPPRRQDVDQMLAEFRQRRGDPSRVPPTDDGKWAIFELAWAEELDARLRRGDVPRAITARVTAARLGPLGVVAFPFEIYSQIGLDIRRLLEPLPVMVAAYTNGLIGYAPTRQAKAQCGYGPSCSHRFFPELLTAVGDGADELLATSAVDLLQQVQPPPTNAEPASDEESEPVTCS